MKSKAGYAISSVILALMLAGLACAGGGAAPTTAPTQAAPTQAPATAAATAATAATTAPTEAPKATGTTAAPTSAPTGAAPATAAPTKAPLSGTLDVLGVSTYVDSAQYFHVVGLVTNGTDKPVNNIELALQVADGAGKTVLKDDSGNPTSTVSVNTMLTTLDSGESSPFDYDMSVSSTDTSGWKPTIKIAKNDTPTDLHRTPVDVVNPQISVHSDGQIYLTGELANKSDKPAQINDFAGAMLDASGKVAAAAHTTALTKLLAPAGDASGSDRTPFAISIYGPVSKDAKPAYYLDAVEGNPDDLSSASNVHLKLDTSYVDADNGVHVVATISNSGTETITAQVVAGLYDQAGLVLDADSGGTPFDIPPGGSSPAILYYFGNLNGNADEINKVVSSTAQIDAFWTFATTFSVVNLQATDVTTTTSGSSVTIKGTIVNTSKENIDTPTVIVEAKDADGKIVAADWTGATADAPVKPGAKATFELTLQTPAKTDPSTLKYNVSVQARVSQ